MNALSGDVSLVLKEVFCKVNESVEYLSQDWNEYDEAGRVALHLWNLFLNQELTDIVISIVDENGDISIGAHRVIIARMTALREKVDVGESVIKLHGVDPKCFLHILAYAYVGASEAVLIRQVQLPGTRIEAYHAIGLDDSFPPSQKFDDGSGEPGGVNTGGGPPQYTVSAEEKLFCTKLIITAKQLGFTEALDRLQQLSTTSPIGGSCKCYGGTNVNCPLRPANFDEETWLEYFRLIHGNFTPNEMPYKELVESAVELSKANEGVPAALETVFREAPHFAQQVAECPSNYIEPLDPEQFRMLIEELIPQFTRNFSQFTPGANS
ncbi:hypothetical protein TWF281_003797 [Arthrobotrys megalospora]